MFRFGCNIYQLCFLNEILAEIRHITFEFLAKDRCFLRILFSTILENSYPNRVTDMSITEYLS